jgi:outer membrane protein TolC
VSRVANSTLRLMAVLFIGAWLGGCTVGPKYSRPQAPAAPEYKETPPHWKQAQPADQVIRGKWWEVFQDSQLNVLEEQVNV